LDDPKAAHSSIRAEVKRLLAEGMRDRANDELASLLGHADMRIRQRAQFELSRRRESATLLSVAQSATAAPLARIHALWGLGQMRHPLQPDQLPLRDASPEIRAQSAKIAGDLRLRQASDLLVGLLSDPSPRVRCHAALALGKAGVPGAVKPLAELLAVNDDADAFLRHTFFSKVCSMVSGGWSQLKSLLSSPSAAIFGPGGLITPAAMKAPARPWGVQRECSGFAPQHDRSTPGISLPLRSPNELLYRKEPP
jgi:hypothetical protein